MTAPLRLVALTILFATLIIAGCAAPIRPLTENGVKTSIWHGRLAIRIDPETPTAEPQSFSASFELTGSPSAGQLNLLTPIGSTAASLSWSPTTAVMSAQGEQRHFESLDALIQQAVGTDIPVAALFAWLAGTHMSTAGWTADLTQHAQGRITARRTSPLPGAELRLILDK